MAGRPRSHGISFAERLTVRVLNVNAGRNEKILNKMRPKFWWTYFRECR